MQPRRKKPRPCINKTCWKLELGHDNLFQNIVSFSKIPKLDTKKQFYEQLNNTRRPKR